MAGKTDKDVYLGTISLFLAEGGGVVVESHDAEVQVDQSSGSFSMGGGWEVSEQSGNGPASLTITSTGSSSLSNGGNTVEGTNDDGHGNLSGLHTINTDQHAIGNNQFSVDSSGDDIMLGFSGSSTATGWGSSSSAGEVTIDSNQESGWGADKP